MKDALVFLIILISIVYFGFVHRASVVADNQANKIEMIECSKLN